MLAPDRERHRDTQHCLATGVWQATAEPERVYSGISAVATQGDPLVPTLRTGTGTIPADLPSTSESPHLRQTSRRQPAADRAQHGIEIPPREIAVQRRTAGRCSSR